MQILDKVRADLYSNGIDIIDAIDVAYENGQTSTYTSDDLFLADSALKKKESLSTWLADIHWKTAEEVRVELFDCTVYVIDLNLISHHPNNAKQRGKVKNMSTYETVKAGLYHYGLDTIDEIEVEYEGGEVVKYKLDDALEADPEGSVEASILGWLDQVDWDNVVEVSLETHEDEKYKIGLGLEDEEDSEDDDEEDEEDSEDDDEEDEEDSEDENLEEEEVEAEEVEEVDEEEDSEDDEDGYDDEYEEDEDQ
ncbi:hypothetical protein [Paenibacillus guangzhouensis]|uniref:hypothetical protein n=1 Tax=Paenibacillus guangzhouensis TaxID=1473112 RepID=UPI00187B1561|nr:hypothetical protein [Paenibacillus guangzhouensis]